MTFYPVITCGLGIGFAAVFEIAHSYLDKRWSTPGTKQDWLAAFWLLVIGVLTLCRIMPYTPPDVFLWAPFIAVVGIHVFMVCDGDGFHRLPRPPSSRPHATPSKSKSQRGTTP